MVGDTGTGYIVAPLGDGLRKELMERCGKINSDPSKCVRIFNINTVQQSAQPDCENVGGADAASLGGAAG